MPPIWFRIQLSAGAMLALLAALQLYLIRYGGELDCGLNQRSSFAVTTGAPLPGPSPGSSAGPVGIKKQVKGFRLFKLAVAGCDRQPHRGPGAHRPERVNDNETAGLRD